MKLVTVAEMRELEAAAVEAGVSERQLMEEAGLAVAQEAWMLLGTLEGRHILVLAGPGNNGGDGIVAARHLLDWGAEVLISLPKTRKDMSLVEELGGQAGVILGDEDPGEERLRGAVEHAVPAPSPCLPPTHGYASTLCQCPTTSSCTQPAKEKVKLQTRKHGHAGSQPTASDGSNTKCSYYARRSQLIGLRF
jgi:hypothetical protein